MDNFAVIQVNIFSGCQKNIVMDSSYLLRLLMFCCIESLSQFFLLVSRFSKVSRSTSEAHSFEQLLNILKLSIIRGRKTLVLAVFDSIHNREAPISY